jgi:hypothetical protein
MQTSTRTNSPFTNPSYMHEAKHLYEIGGASWTMLELIELE